MTLHGGGAWPPGGGMAAIFRAPSGAALALIIFFSVDLSIGLPFSANPGRTSVDSRESFWACLGPPKGGPFFISAALPGGKNG